MSSYDNVPQSQRFQFRLTIEEWMAAEFERTTIQHDKLLDVLDQVRFIGINGLIQREGKKVSPFYFKLISDQGVVFLIIAFSIQIFQSLDSIALQTAMEYFASILKFTVCEQKPLNEAEIAAFSDIKRLLPIRYQNQDIIPYEDFTAKIEIQMRMKTRIGLQIIPTTSIDEKIKSEKMKHLKALRTAKRALANIQSNLREYSQQIAKKYRINVEGFLFQINIKNRFEPVFIPIFSLNSASQVTDLFSVLVITEEVVNRLAEHDLEIMIAHEIIFDLLKSKFSRGALEKEIFLILSGNTKDDPELLIKKEMSKFYKIQEITEAQNRIKEAIESLLSENYPILRLD